MKRSGSRRRVLRLSLAAVVVTGVLLVATYAGTALVVEIPLEDPDAILVLASHEWERLPAAAEQARRSPSALLFITQPRHPSIHNCHDCEHRADRLIAFGISPSRIVTLPSKVSNTRDEAEAARVECAQRQVRRLLVVTSPYHTRRARQTFQQAFARTSVVIGIVASDASPARPERWWNHAYDRAYVRYEWAAIAYHAMRDSLGTRN